MDHEWIGTNINQEWITKRSFSDGTHSLVWDTYKKVSDYHLLRLMRVTNPVRTEVFAAPADPSIKIEVRRLKAATWTQKMRHWWNKFTWSDTIFNRDLYVYLPAVSKCSGSMAFKTRQVYQMSTLHKEVLDLVLADRLWDGLPPDTPFSKTKVVQDTVLWLFWSGFLDEVQLTQGVANDAGVDWAQYKHLRTSLGKTQYMSAWIPSLIGLMLLVILISKILPRNRWLRMSLWNSLSSERGRQKLSILMEIASPILEEWFKKMFGFAGSFSIAAVETALIMKRTGNEAEKWWKIATGFIVKLGAQELFRNSSHPIFLHSFWNSCVNMVSGNYSVGSAGLIATAFMGPVEAFFKKWFKMNLLVNMEKQRFLSDYLKVRSHLNEYQGPLPLTYQEAVLPAILTAPLYKDMPVTSEMAIEGGTDNKVYVLLGTTAMMYRPTGPAVFWHAYVARNLQPVPITPICEDPDDPCDFNTQGCEVGDRWLRVAYHMSKRMRRNMRHHDLEPLKAIEWVQHFGTAAKKQRAREGIEIRNSGLVRKRTGIFLKADEVLYGRDGVLKARTVKSLDPTIQALLYKPIEFAMQQLKAVFNEKQVYKIGDWQLTMAVGSGRLSSELDKWLMISYDWVHYGDKRIAAIMAGDDFFAVVSCNGKIEYWENDFKCYDRTQGVHALNAEWIILETLGVPYAACDILFSTVIAPPRYQVAKFDIKKKLPMPPQRATGGPDTTIGNTIVNMLSLWYAIREDNSLDRLEERQLELGLMAKLHKHSDLSSATFLKGWWLLTATKFAWHPLPSQVVKVGKILTNPEDIFKNHSVDSAWRSAACSMGATYGLVPRSYPLFGTLLARYDSFNGTVVELPSEGVAHKVKIDEVLSTDVSYALEQIALRYGLSYTEIDEMCSEIKSAPFPGLMTHHGWGILAQRDYG
jgi:hypothetical protein